MSAPEDAGRDPGRPLRHTARAALLALGGASWPRLGSNGAGCRDPEPPACRDHPFRPANAGFAVAWSDRFRERFSGAPLKRIALACDGTTVRGEAVVTEFGLEGGAVYALSRSLRAAIAVRGNARPSGSAARSDPGCPRPPPVRRPARRFDRDPPAQGRGPRPRSGRASCARQAVAPSRPIRGNSPG